MPAFIIPRDIPRCHHIKTNGVRCGSPSLRSRKFFYFYARIRRQEQRRNGERPDLDIPFLEDAASVQCAIVKVKRALVEGKLDTKTAGLLVYALQTASFNIKSMREPEWMDVESDRRFSSIRHRLLRVIRTRELRSLLRLFTTSLQDGAQPPPYTPTHPPPTPGGRMGHPYISAVLLRTQAARLEYQERQRWLFVFQGKGNGFGGIPTGSLSLAPRRCYRWNDNGRGGLLNWRVYSRAEIGS